MPFASLTGLKNRLRDRADSAARGSDVPAGIERGADAVAPAGARDRGRMRRRLRELRRLREAQLMELGALVLEARKHGREDSPIIATKAAEAAATDAEARGIERALDTHAGLDTLVHAGIAGPCPTCGTLTSTTARFCSTCGTPLDGRPDAAPREAAPAATPLTDARHVDADAADADVDAAANGDAPVADPAPVTHPEAADPAAPTELRAPNGNGAAHEEVKTTSGRES